MPYRSLLAPLLLVLAGCASSGSDDTGSSDSNISAAPPPSSEARPFSLDESPGPTGVKVRLSVDNASFDESNQFALLVERGGLFHLRNDIFVNFETPGDRGIRIGTYSCADKSAFFGASRANPNGGAGTSLPPAAECTLVIDAAKAIGGSVIAAGHFEASRAEDGFPFDIKGTFLARLPGASLAATP